MESYLALRRGILGRAMQNPKLAAARLAEAHARRQSFAPLPAELAPRTPEEAYAIQDCYVARRAESLGAPLEDWHSVDLAAVRGVARINGRVVGEGRGDAAMGHPLEALAWVANHLAAHGRALVFRDVVITGSMITTKTVQAGDLVKFE